jgi:hypothetical protein
VQTSRVCTLAQSAGPGAVFWPDLRRNTLSCNQFQAIEDHGPTAIRKVVRLPCQVSLHNGLPPRGRGTRQRLTGTCHNVVATFRLIDMRDRETIDSELRLIALRRQAVREQGGQLSSRELDALLDERLGHPVEAAETEAVEPEKTKRRTPKRRRSVLLRFGPLAVLPLSLLAIATALVVMFGLRHAGPAQPAEAAPTEAGPPSAAPPSAAAPPSPASPEAHPAPAYIVDTAFISVLKQDGVPVPSQEYVTSHGHAVCDFLAHQPNFAEAVRFVQGSSIWDASQSARFAAGAVVSYCPQYEAASLTPIQQPGLQNALPDLEAIERDLQRIQGDLKNIRDGLPAVPGYQ